ncbi:GTP-binding protein 2-like [Branchiostoma floridae]|uniref:GTP-binding protein 2-like n=1 Tax=Branchiostoma floridae TaxID=7739 RepID=C3XRA4_BRAFL|nr:GTP-binding protein 2-like [Branchiostoma floridae]|eukprot:XP_002613213.1 hypothetical protein BRAFLDRAFT_278061 [Branchiostoma floridae]
MDPMCSLFGDESEPRSEKKKRRPSRPTSLDLRPRLPPEVEEGNVEYKLKLLNPSPSRFEHLVTQMKWRLQEGGGEAIYEIGVEDSGMMAGLTEDELKRSLYTLNRMAEKLGATTSILRERDIEGDEEIRKAAEVLVRKVPDDQQFLDLRLAVLGNVDAGKSTLLGVLTQGELDNGRGRARLNMFRHLHEIQSGRTSSIGHEILGFDSHGNVINYNENRTAAEICESASKLITFIDLAGHQKYLKTTIFGLTGYNPDYTMLVISANTGIVGMTKEHLGLALALKLPIFIVISKTDLCSAAVTERTLKQVERVLKSPGCNRIPLRIENEDDAITAAANFNTDRITPIFRISSVSGENLDLLRRFLNVLPPPHSGKEQEQLMQELTEYQVDEMYTVPGAGTVVGGTLYRGVAREGDSLLIGPNEAGSFLPVSVNTVHRNRAPCRVVKAGQTATLALGDVDRTVLRKGMVLLSPELQPVSCLEFEAEVLLLFHTTYICKGFQTTVHVGNVCQTAIIDEVEDGYITINQKRNMRFRFVKHPEYLREGTRLLFREGRTKGIGTVTKVFPYTPVDR